MIYGIGNPHLNMKPMTNTKFPLALTMPVAAVMIIGGQSSQNEVDRASNKAQDAEEPGTANNDLTVWDVQE